MCINVKYTTTGPMVSAASGDTMKSTHKATIPLSPHIDLTAQTGHILDSLQNGSLVSIGKLCDDNCIAIFTKNNVFITKNGVTLIKGHRTRPTGLYTIPCPQPKQYANSAVRNCTTKTDLARFLHGAAFSPTPSSFLRAIKRGHFNTWPGLTVSLITKYLPKAIFATSQGHLRGQQKNIRSTKTWVNNSPPPINVEDIAPSQEANNPSTHNIFLTIDTKPFARSYSDQTGRFPVQSLRGNNYVFILYDYDSNAILAKAIPNRRGSTIKMAWEQIHKALQQNGYCPKLHIIDNECSEDIKASFRQHHVDFQRVPPHQHRRNAAERAIQTWKHHFIAGLASCDPSFPMKAWDLLIPQANITINLLRSSRRQPNLSAYHCLFGVYNFNRTPLAVPGTKALVHKTPDQRASWDTHGVQAYYIGPSMEHYRCYKFYVPSTNGIRDAPTVKWFPHTVPFPQVTTDTYLRQTAEDMLHILQQRHQPNIPKLQYGSSLSNAYIQIAQILKRATAPPPTLPPTQNAPSVPRLNQQDLPDRNPVKVPRVDSIPYENMPERHPAKPPRVAPTPLKLVHPLKPNESLHPYIKKPAPKQHITKHRRCSLPYLRHRYNTRLQQTRRTRFLAQTAIPSHKYQHHIAALTTTPVQKQKAGSIHKLLKGPDATTWERSLANEFGRLLPHGVGNTRPPHERVQGTSTIFPIRRADMPQNRTATYANFVCDIRPQKKETHRVRCTAGGNLLDYPDDPSSPAVSVLDAKIHINSTISDAHKGARYMCVDIKNFYLGNNMDYYQYLRVSINIIPTEIVIEYNLKNYVEPDGYVYFEIRKGMYGLKEAGIIAFNNLVKNLAPFGYEPMPYTPGLWRHKTKPTTFTLCVDDFGVKYFSKTDADHFIHALQSNYETTIDWTGSLYVGINLRWNYAEGYVDASMDGFTQRALQKYNHPIPTRPQHAPHDYTTPIYGRTQPQTPVETPAAPPLDKAQTKMIQGITGTFNYYSEIDPCIKPALNEIASQQAAPTEITKKKATMLMDYLHTYPNATIRYHASDMVLVFETDAAYLVLPKARSRIAGWYVLTSDPSKTNSVVKPNGPLHIMCMTPKNVLASAAEAETSGVYHGFQRAVPMRVTLEELGHKQPPLGTPAFTDNSTAHGILTSKMRRKLSKAFDMRYHWVKDRIAQNQFNLQWRKGDVNMADYFTKHHPPWKHKIMRYKYLQKSV